MSGDCDLCGSYDHVETSCDYGPIPLRRRRRLCDSFGHRAVNNWGSGDLPAPYAEGDLLWLPRPCDASRLRSRGLGERGWYVVTYAPSIDEGDAWYFRVTNRAGERNSDRLHVAYADRSGFDEDVNWMAPFELVETADPEGLALRERLLAEGWSYTPPTKCPTCGQRTWEDRP